MGISDGAYGTLLADFADGCGVDWMCSRRPDIVVSAHRSYVLAGAREIQTCSFMAWSYPLEQQSLMYEAAIAAAQTAIAQVKREQPLNVVSSLTVGPATDPAAFLVAIECANAERMDMVVETVTSHRSLDALGEALSSTTLRGRLWVCASADPARAKATEHVGALVDWCDEFNAIPGLNCCAGASDNLQSLVKYLRDRDNARLVPSAGVGDVMSPGTWASTVAALASDLSQPIVGGCCGTTPDHIHHLTSLVSSRGQ